MHRFIFLIAMAWAAVASGALAQDVPATCSADVWDVMRVRAEMEGKRELEMAQTIILKADSVLEYGCFESRMAALENWSMGMDGFQDQMGLYLNLAVRGPLGSYLNSNFGHSFGGGLGAPGGGVCGAMGAVWQFLKCQTFDIDNFRQFAEFIASDPRQLPAACQGNHSGEWSTLIAAANPNPGALGGGDPAHTFFNLLNPSSCSSLTPIPTGAIVNVGGDEYPDAVCPGVGCSYNGSGGCH